MVKGDLRRAAKRSYPVLCADYTYSDWRSQRKYRSGNLETHSGTLHQTLTRKESVAYVGRVFVDYKTYSGVRQFAGRVAEVGPGDNCGAGLLFTLDGCALVDLVDRFYSLRDLAEQAKIYGARANAHPGLHLRIEGIPLTDASWFPDLRRRYGAQAAAEVFFEANTGYDFIVSRAVFEHLYFPLIALSTMARALAPAGMLLHKIDLRDHTMFSDHSMSSRFSRSRTGSTAT